MRSAYEIIKSLLITEKSTNLKEKSNKYTFLVDKKSNKIEIKRAVQEIYKVKVKDVNTMILPGKLRRVRFQAGYAPDYKRAIVTLEEGEKIDQKI